MKEDPVIRYGAELDAIIEAVKKGDTKTAAKLKAALKRKIAKDSLPTVRPQ